MGREGNARRRTTPRRLGKAVRLERVRFCPLCSSLFRGEFTCCAVDGTRLSAVATGRDPVLGRAIDRFRVDRFLGEGSTGRVYEAVHRTQEARFAIKLVWGDLAADQRVQQRFRRAAELTAQLGHPNVVEVLELTVTAGGLVLLVMPLVPGPSLRQLLAERGPMTPAEVLPVARQLVHGLGAAHAAGFVHRDVKPANLVLSDPEDLLRAQLRILDFGLAGLTVLDQDARITASGTFVGTPLYMAPEQARSAAEVSPAADFYAVGVLIHEMLTGLPPFEGQTPLEVMIAHSTRAPPPLPPSAGLEQVVAWCLQKRPEARPQTARALLAELDRVADRLARAPRTGPATALVETLEMEPVGPQ